MRIAHINVVAGLSTGRIAVAICRAAMQRGHRVLLCHSRDFAPPDVPSYRVGTRPTTGSKPEGKRLFPDNVKWHTYAHILYARLTDRAGFFGRADTQKLVKQLEAFKPDIIHLHNIHGYYLHVPTLFRYIRRENIPVVWTLHDCWAYTGHCAYYTMAVGAPPPDGVKRRAQASVGCERWLTGCGRCTLLHNYPASWLVDQSARNWREKRELFCGLQYMVLTTPSEWLQGEVRRSFLSKYPVYTLPNGIDLEAFKPCLDERYMRDVVIHSKLGELGGKRLVLSVASTWEPRKGLEDLIDLATALGDGYCVAAVGLDEYQIASLPGGTVLGLPRTGNLNDLCALYTAADLYVSTCHEETMGMTLVEALACGTQVLCYNATAMPEIVTDEVGAVTPLGDIEAMAQAVRELCDQPKAAESCRARASEYDAGKRFAAYMQLYENMYRHSPAYQQALDEGEKRRRELWEASEAGKGENAVE